MIARILGVLSLFLTIVPVLADSTALLAQAASATPTRVDYAKQQGATVTATTDNKAFSIWWQPSSEAPTAVIVTLHGHASYAYDEFFLWHPYAKTRNYAVLALQWWFGGGEATTDYYLPNEMYPLIATILSQKGILPGQVLFHGFSRGGANSYAMAALDTNSANRYFGTVISNAGSAVSNFPPNMEIVQGKFGKLPFSGVKWIMYCGEKDPEPELSGCIGMKKSQDWVKTYGATISLFIDDATGDHGGFHINSSNVNNALSVYAPSMPYADVDRVYNWGECKYATLLQPKTTSRALAGYWARCYAKSVCLGVREDKVWYYDGKAISDLGALSNFVAQVPASGC